MFVFVVDCFEPLNSVVSVAPLFACSLLADAVVDVVEYRLTNLAEITLGGINKTALRVVLKVLFMVLE